MIFNIAMMSQFSAYITSNGSKEFYPDNTLSNFSVKFPFSLDLATNENEKWAISINRIGLSSKFGTRYEKYNNEPLLIQILNLRKPDICDSSQTCDKVKQLNTYFSSLFNRCYYGEEVKENCNPEPMESFFRVWGLKNLVTYFGFPLMDNNDPLSIFTRFKRFHQINYYHNPMESLKDLRILIKQLQGEGGFIVKKINEMKYEISVSSVVSSERIIFLRDDFINNCSFSQNASFINPKKQSVKTILFPNIEKARELNGNLLSFGPGNSSHKYFMFVFNVEFKSLTLEIKKFVSHAIAIPNLIKIKCDNIRNQVFNNTHSNDIEVIKPVFENNGSHYFHDFENPVFVPLLTTRLSDLNFKLTDEYDDGLILSTGLPTILSATFKKMLADYKSFNIRLTPGQDSVENTSSKFKNILPNTFTFNNNWFVGLKDITFPNQFKILPSDENEIVVVKLTPDLKVIESERHRISILNLKVNLREFIRHLNLKVFHLNAFTFEIDETANIVSIKAVTDVRISISKHLAQILGFLPLVFSSEAETPKYWKQTLTTNSTQVADTPLSIDLFRPAYLMIYMDFVELTLISSEYSNILKIVPVKIEPEHLECQTLEFKSIEYRKLGKMIVGEINTEIRDPSGKLVQFDGDKVALHLFFTNNPLK